MPVTDDCKVKRIQTLMEAVFKISPRSGTKNQRGGLFFINYEVYVYFFEQENSYGNICPNSSLTNVANRLLWMRFWMMIMCCTFQWCLISTVVEDATALQELLGMLVKLRLTIRGFSQAAAYLEF